MSSAIETNPKVERVKAEAAFGRRVQRWIAEAGATVTEVARGLGIRREQAYELFEGEGHIRAAWLEMLPAAVELRYLAERAAVHGRELRWTGDAGSAHARLHSLVVELTDVIRVGSVSEADGHVSPEEATEELREIEEAERALTARKAWLRKAIEERGLRVVNGGAR